MYNEIGEKLMNKYNKKNYNNNKKVIIIVTIIILLVILTAGITYAYYETNIIGNTKNERSVNLTSDKLEIIYDTEENNDVVTGNVGENASTNSYSKTFTIKSTAKETGKYTIILDNIENNFVKTWDWTYKLYKIEQNGQPIEEEPNTPIAEGVIGKELKRQVIRAEEEIEGKGTNKYKLEVTYDSTKPDGKILEQKLDETTGKTTWEEEQQPIIETGSNLKFRINIMGVNENIFKEDSEEGTLLYAIGKNNPIVNTLTEPGKESSGTNEAILSYTQDDYGTSYYYRGSVDNNYVTFNKMCWRVVRVLGNGNIKLALRSESSCNELTDDTKLTEKDNILKAGTSFNKSDGTANSVRYTNSIAMTKINEWFEANFQDYMDETKIVSSEWCQDMSVSSIGDNSDTRLGGYTRYYETSPDMYCRFESDVDNSVSELVKYRVALLTMDEYLFSGVKTGVDTKTLSFLADLYRTNSRGYYWTMTPLCFGNCNGGQYGGDLVYESLYSPVNVNNNNGNDFVRPSIVLSKDVKISRGVTGEINDSYVIE